MILKESLIYAYATLVKKGNYILDEEDRSDQNQKLVSEEYITSVAEYLIQSK